MSHPASTAPPDSGNPQSGHPQSGHPDRFSRFAELSDALAATSSKLQKRALVSEYLSSLDDAAASLAATYLIGRAFPESDPRILGVEGAFLSAALLQLTGLPDQALTAAYRLHGDLGSAARDLFMAAAPPHSSLTPALSLHHVAESFSSLAATTKRAPRLNLLLHLLGAASPSKPNT